MAKMDLQFQPVTQGANYSLEILRNLEKLRYLRLYTDVILRVQEKSFHVHKVILAASSRYFHAMFSGGMQEASQSEVELKDESLTVEAFELLLNFIYSSSLPLTDTNVIDVLEGADQLEILGAVEICSSYIMNIISQQQFDMETGLKILRATDRHSLYELREEIFHAIALRFGEICEKESFMLNTTADELLLLLSRDDLSVPSETFLFKTVIAWIRYDKESRLSHAARLLCKVRLALVDIMAVLEELESEDFRDIPDCFTLMHEALVQYVRPFLSSPFAKEKGLPRASSKALVALSWKDDAQYFDCVSRCWKPLHGFKLPSLQCKPAVAQSGNFLFLFDGNQVHQYDINLNHWKTLPSMKNNHKNFSACVLKDYLYVIGGCEDNHMVVSERFSFFKKAWQYISFHEELGMYGCAITVFNSRIYSIGGSWAEGGADRGVYKFDPMKNEWTKEAGTLHSHTQACAFVVNNRLYVAGGKSDPPSKRQRGLVPSKRVEVYDEDNDKWYDVPQPHVPPNSCGAIEIQDCIFFIVGNFAFDSGIRIDENDAYQIDITGWETICNHGEDVVFAYLPVDKMKEVHQTLSELALLEELAEETDDKL